MNERQSPSGSIVYKAVCHEGAEELKRKSSSLAWSGLAAGLSMGFSMVTEGLLHGHLPSARWTPLISKLGYSVGFLIVILGRQQLFTENTLTVILPLASRPSLKTLWNVLRLWAVVLFSNVVGALIFAAVVSHSSVFETDIRAEFARMGAAAMTPAFGTLILRGIFAGWLIALMVWLLPFAESFRVIVIILITYVVALGDFAHIIAGSVDTLFVVCLGKISILHWFTHFFIPVLLGNILGGVPLVALINHAQIVAGENGEDA